MTPSEIKSLVDALAPRVALELSKLTSPLLTRSQLAQQFGVTVATIDRLVRRGLPVHHVATDRRFIAAECVAWLDAQSSGRSTSEVDYTLRTRKVG